MKNIFTENIDKYGIINLIILVSLPIIIAFIIVSKQDINTTTSIGAFSSSSSYSNNKNVSNDYGTSIKKCHHTGCDRNIASSGDTIYCTVHSNKCKICGKYIDEDALVCMDCVRKNLGK